MPPKSLRNCLIAFALALAPAAAAQQGAPADGPDKRALETVHFASLDGKTNLTAYLDRHPGDAPRPAVVLMHGCSGLLNAQGRIFPIFRAWMRALFAKGYDVLTVDSAASRGFGQTCSPGPNRITMWRDRPSDAWTQVEPQGWTTPVPLLVLFGAADTWTPLAPCEEFLGGAKARGNPVELKTYANAVHAFDAPDLPRTELPAYRLGNGQVPVIGTDRQARADAFPRVLESLKLHLQSN
jgi:dienelactone hydrolase